MGDIEEVKGWLKIHLDLDTYEDTIKKFKKYIDEVAIKEKYDYKNGFIFPVPKLYSDFIFIRFDSKSCNEFFKEALLRLETIVKDKESYMSGMIHFNSGSCEDFGKDEVWIFSYDDIVKKRFLWKKKDFE